MGWIKALLGLLGALADYFRDRQLIDAGKAKAVAAGQKETIHEIAVAQEARAAVERDLTLRPGGLRDDDGFKRPE